MGLFSKKKKFFLFLSATYVFNTLLIGKVVIVNFGLNGDIRILIFQIC